MHHEGREGRDAHEPRKKPSRCVCFVIVVCFVVNIGAQAQLVRARIDTVTVTVTVTDATGRLVPHLTINDFEIFEDGEPQAVTQFTDQRVPVSLGVLRRSDPFVYAVAIDAPDSRASTLVNPDALREITGPSGGDTEVVRGAATTPIRRRAESAARTHRDRAQLLQRLPVNL